MSEQPLDISVVAPAYNEFENVEPLVEAIIKALRATGRTFEVIIVDDQSTDETLPRLRCQSRLHPELRVFTQRPRSGQTAALASGFRQARGKYVATLDADLQNDPGEIPRMIEYLENDECDMVNGWRQKRNDNWVRRISSKFANGIRNWLSGETIHDSACSLKVYRSECLKNIKFFNGLHRFMPTLVKLEGYRVIEIPVNHRPRYAGTAKYGVWNRALRALRDLFAIRWMKSRMIRCEVAEVLDESG